MATPEGLEKFAQLLDTEEGRKKLAEVMSSEIYRKLWEPSLVQAVFHRTYKFEGELEVWDKELGWNITNSTKVSR